MTSRTKAGRKQHKQWTCEVACRTSWIRLPPLTVCRLLCDGRGRIWESRDTDQRQLTAHKDETRRAGRMTVEPSIENSDNIAIKHRIHDIMPLVETEGIKILILC